MVAGDAAAADGVKPDLARRPRARLAAAAVPAQVGERCAAAGRDRATQRQRGAARRVRLPPVVRLDDLDVVAVPG